jgi:hypothetical protein
MKLDEARALLVDLGMAVGPGDEGTLKAIGIFQRGEDGLERTGTLDAKTAARLKKMAGENPPDPTPEDAA